MPMRPGHPLTLTDPTCNDVIREFEISQGVTALYPMVVRSLMYAMLGTHPNIAYAVGVLGHFSAAPKLCHWTAAKRVLRYLRGTHDMCLTYGNGNKSKHLKFTGYSNADWSGDQDTSKLTSGFMFLANGAAIGWSSKLQPLVALSTTKSKYIGLSLAGQHLAWLCSFFEEVSHTQKEPNLLLCDNQVVIILSRDAQFHVGTKHIVRKFHYVRDDLIGVGKANVMSRVFGTHELGHGGSIG